MFWSALRLVAFESGFERAESAYAAFDAFT